MVALSEIRSKRVYRINPFVPGHTGQESKGGEVEMEAVKVLINMMGRVARF